MPRTKSGEQPRRRPDRRTGREIVAAIFDAMVHLLEAGDFDAVTSNHIAERAGVSIGSFYRYFPNKQAVVGEMARQLEQRTRAVAAERALAGQTGEARGGTLELIRAFVGVLFARELGDVSVRRALLEHVPRRWIRAASDEVNAEVRRRVAALIAQRPDTRDGGDADLLAFVVVHACEGVCEAAVLERPELLANGALERELVELAHRYLAAPRRSATSPR